MTDEEILKKHGYYIVTQAPLEINDADGNYAVGFSARIVLDYFKELEAEEEREVISNGIIGRTIKYGSIDFTANALILDKILSSGNTRYLIKKENGKVVKINPTDIMEIIK